MTQRRSAASSILRRVRLKAALRKQPIAPRFSDVESLARAGGYIHLHELLSATAAPAVPNPPVL